MEWLIGIGRSKLGASNSSSRTGRAQSDEVQKERAYMVTKTSQYHLVAKVTKEELQSTVPVPMGVDIDEWLATNTLSFYKHISLVYDSIHEHCTHHACSNLSNGAHMNFTWVDERGKKVRMSAPQYIELVIINIEKLITDENVFPTKYDMYFPTNFASVVKKIFRMLFHILAHIYQSHYMHVDETEQIDLLNTVFIHFMYFQTEHSLLEAKELSPLEDLIKSLCL